MNGKVEDQYNYFSIYSKHSKKNGTLWKFSGTRYTAINLRNIIQLKKKKVNKKKLFSPVSNTALHNFTCPNRPFTNIRSINC